MYIFAQRKEDNHIFLHWTQSAKLIHWNGAYLPLILVNTWKDSWVRFFKKYSNLKPCALLPWSGKNFRFNEKSKNLKTKKIFNFKHSNVKFYNIFHGFATETHHFSPQLKQNSVSLMLIYRIQILLIAYTAEVNLFQKFIFHGKKSPEKSTCIPIIPKISMNNVWISSESIPSFSIGWFIYYVVLAVCVGLIRPFVKFKIRLIR